MRARSRRGGHHLRPLLVAPGILSTGVTPWDVSDTADYEAPPAVAYHVIGDDGRLTTHYRPVDLAVYPPVDLAAVSGRGG